MLTEAAIRTAVVRDVAAAVGQPAHVVFEFWVPRSHERADVAVIGRSTLHGLEIKTARDSLKRLPRQAAAYTRIFDRCEAVLATRHLEVALEILPPWWGVRLVNDDASLTMMRAAEPNSGVDAEILVRLLWRDEAYAAVSGLDDDIDPRACRHQLWTILLDTLDIESLKTVVRHALLSRKATSARVPTRRFAVS